MTPEQIEARIARAAERMTAHARTRDQIANELGVAVALDTATPDFIKARRETFRIYDQMMKNEIDEMVNLKIELLHAQKGA